MLTVLSRLSCLSACVSVWAGSDGCWRYGEYVQGSVLPATWSTLIRRCHTQGIIVILLLFINNKLSVLRPPSRWTWVSRCLLKQRMMEVVVTTGDVSRAKLQSNHHHQQTNTQFFTGRIPFLSPNQQCQSTEGKDTTFPGVAYPKLTWSLPTLSLTTNCSWLPWGRVAMPLISPLMPVPHS